MGNKESVDAFTVTLKVREAWSSHGLSDLPKAKASARWSRGTLIGIIKGLHGEHFRKFTLTYQSVQYCLAPFPMFSPLVLNSCAYHLAAGFVRTVMPPYYAGFQFGSWWNMRHIAPGSVPSQQDFQILLLWNHLTTTKEGPLSVRMSRDNYIFHVVKKEKKILPIATLNNICKTIGILMQKIMATHF